MSSSSDLASKKQVLVSVEQVDNTPIEQTQKVPFYKSPLIMGSITLFTVLAIVAIALGSTLGPKSKELPSVIQQASPGSQKPSPPKDQEASSNFQDVPSNVQALPPNGTDTAAGKRYKNVCNLTPHKDGLDDGPAILKAFQTCSEDSKIVFSNHTFNVGIVMDTRGLQNVDIELKGTLLWSTEIQYWLNNSLPMGYQNQSTAWLLGGDNLSFTGHGFGTFDGNGQTWYNFVRGESNYPRRPHALTISNTTNSVFRGLRFVQSQMWTMTVIHSRNVLLEDIYVSSTSQGPHGTINTDGADTIYADNITFNRWEVINGDDAISPKANSSNILVTNSVFHRGTGFAVGSIGQYNGVFETIQNVSIINCTFIDTTHAVYFKTWTGQHVGYPPNGGGGGIGFITNITLHNTTIHNLRNTPLSISQCTVFAGAAGDCNSSLFRISNVTMSDIKGTINQNPLTSFQCSEKAHCRDFEITGVDVRLRGGGRAEGYRCNYLDGTRGFECTGRTCEHPSGDGTC